jgi:hypothetical protein
MNIYQEYEKRKAELDSSATDYEIKLKELVEELGI